MLWRIIRREAFGWKALLLELMPGWGENLGFCGRGNCFKVAASIHVIAPPGGDAATRRQDAGSFSRSPRPFSFLCFWCIGRLACGQFGAFPALLRVSGGGSMAAQAGVADSRWQTVRQPAPS